MTLASGDFVNYRLTEDEQAPEEIGLVVRVSQNEYADGSKEDYVELVGPLTKYLVKASQCAQFDAPPTQDPNETVGGSAASVGGVTPKSKGAK